MADLICDRFFAISVQRPSCLFAKFLLSNQNIKHDHERNGCVDNSRYCRAGNTDNGAYYYACSVHCLLGNGFPIQLVEICADLSGIKAIIAQHRCPVGPLFFNKRNDTFYGGYELRNRNDT